MYQLERIVAMRENHESKSNVGLTLSLIMCCQKYIV